VPGVFPLCVIAFSYIMTVRHLVESSSSLSEDTQNPRLNTRKNTAKVAMGHNFVFLISYVAFYIAETYLFYSINVHIPTPKPVGEIDSIYNLHDIMFILKVLL
jgi:hypothetical protein